MAARTWIAVALAMAVWFGYMKYFAPLPPPPSKVKTATTQTETGSSTNPQTQAPKSPLEVSFSKAEAADSSNVETVKLENDDLSLVFSTVGGKLNDAQLVGFRETIDDSSDIISPVTFAKQPKALATLFSAPELRELSAGNYKISDQTAKSVTFTKRVANAEISKRYQFGENRYFVNADVTIRFLNTLKEPGELMVPLGGTGFDFDAAVPLKAWEFVSYVDKKVERETYDDVDAEKEVLRGSTDWVAFGNKYFASAVVSKSLINPDVVYANESDFRGIYLRYPLALKAGQSELVFSWQYYLGPKDFDLLSKVEGLKQLIDYGFFSFLAFPLLEIMRFFYRIFENYGIAIILLTIVVRIVFYPLSVKSFRSMKHMQKLQPQIKALKEKYKDDQQRFAQEQMALFKQHKVNPMGGCLPMLVQMPVFFALYTVLSNSIELFHAPFFGWIHDLSTKDPYYVYPVLMGISMVGQQKMMPNPGMDPMQAKMMMLMPIVFTFIMLNLPSGLTLYIFLSTILGIAQQYMINREPRTANTSVVENKAT